MTLNKIRQSNKKFKHEQRRRQKRHIEKIKNTNNRIRRGRSNEARNAFTSTMAEDMPSLGKISKKS